MAKPWIKKDLQNLIIINYFNSFIVKELLLYIMESIVIYNKGYKTQKIRKIELGAMS